MTRLLGGLLALSTVLVAGLGVIKPVGAVIDRRAPQEPTATTPPSGPRPTGGARAGIVDGDVVGTAFGTVGNDGSGGGSGGGGRGSGSGVTCELDYSESIDEVRALNGAYRSTEGQDDVRWSYQDCSDGSRDLVPIREGQTAPAAPTLPTLEEVARSVRITPAVPALHTSPPMSVYTLVNFETWFWVEPAEWQPLEGDATAGAVTVTVTATPRELVVDPGDGSGELSCSDGGTPYDMDQPAEGQRSDCVHVYEESSWESPDERTHGTATIVYDITWSGGGIGGNLGTITPDPVPFSIQVAEAQAVNIPPPDDYR